MTPQLLAWALYDLANTFFAIAMLSFYFPLWVVEDLGARELVFSLALAGSMIAVAVLMPFLLFQHYLISFGIPQLPERVVLAKGVEGPLSWQWNLYSQRYFGLWGPPASEDWQIRHVLEQVSRPNGGAVRLGMVPDIPRFDSMAFEFYIALWRFPVTINRLWTFDQGAIGNNDYILVSEKDQGWAPNFSRDLDNINQYIYGRSDFFRRIESFSLPNGDVIRLYKVGSS